MALIRREIPLLEALRRPQAARVIVGRSYPFSRAEPMRVCRGEPLSVWVKVHPRYSHDCRVRFATTLDHGFDEQMRVEECRREGDGTFSWTFTAGRTGSFIFRAAYSLDGGSTWTNDDLPYTWLVVDPPAVNDVRMYTLIPTASGHIGQWKQELERIKTLGCNAVHLLPLTFLDQSESPYSAHELFALDASYLDPHDGRDGLAQWEDFVEFAKKLGMRLCIDLVLNHIGAKSRIAAMKPEWIVSDPARPDGFKRAGCWHGQNWLTWDDLLLLNYEHPDDRERDLLWTYMVQYALFWANYAAYTGGMVRFDNLHSSNPDFLAALSRALKGSYPDLILLAEFFSDQDTLVKRSMEWEIDLLLATPWEYKFVPELRRYLKYLQRVGEQVRFFVPVSSHDSGPPAEEFWSVDATMPRYAVAALLSFGATGLTQGVEWGIPKKVNFIGRNRPLERGSSEVIENFIRRINAILASRRAFRLTRSCKFVDKEHEAIIAAVRWDAQVIGEYFLVAANFDIKGRQTLEVDLSQFLGKKGEIAVEEIVAQKPAVILATPKLQVELGPCEVQVLRCSRPKAALLC